MTNLYSKSLSPPDLPFNNYYLPPIFPDFSLYSFNWRDGVDAFVLFQRRHLNLKVSCYALRIIHGVDKLFLEGSMPYVKSVNSICKYYKMVDSVGREESRGEWVFENRNGFKDVNTIQKILKVTYNYLKVTVATVTLLNENYLIVLGYQAAGLGKHFHPLPSFVADKVAVLAIPLSPFKLVLQAATLCKAYRVWKEAISRDNPQEINAKRQLLFKATLDFTAEGIRLGFVIARIAIIAFPGVGYAVPQVIILVIPYIEKLPTALSVTSASIGLWHYYTPKTDVKNAPERESLAIIEENKNRTPLPHPQEIIAVEAG